MSDNIARSCESACDSLVLLMSSIYNHRRMCCRLMGPTIYNHRRMCCCLMEILVLILLRSQVNHLMMINMIFIISHSVNNLNHLLMMVLLLLLSRHLHVLIEDNIFLYGMHLSLLWFFNMVNNLD